MPLWASPMLVCPTSPRILADRPSVLITEEGNTITIELPNLLILIKTTKP